MQHFCFLQITVVWRSLDNGSKDFIITHNPLEVIHRGKLEDGNSFGFIDLHAPQNDVLEIIRNRAFKFIACEGQ